MNDKRRINSPKVSNEHISNTIIYLNVVKVSIYHISHTLSMHESQIVFGRDYIYALAFTIIHFYGKLSIRRFLISSLWLHQAIPEPRIKLSKPGLLENRPLVHSQCSQIWRKHWQLNDNLMGWIGWMDDGWWTSRNIIIEHQTSNKRGRKIYLHGN